jgi:GNAT superfamily N-acetyltransferase
MVERCTVNADVRGSSPLPGAIKTMEEKEIETVPIQIRYAGKEDEAFIFATWLNSYRKSGFARNIRSSVYFPNHHKLVTALVGKSMVVVATNPEDDAHIYGWACAEVGMEMPIVHYVFVKELYRGFGIGKKLLESMKITGRFAYTHEAAKRVDGAIYCPYFIMGG